MTPQQIGARLKAGSDRYLAFDLGTKCGWAILDGRGKRQSSGVLNLKPTPHEGKGMRVVRFQNALPELLACGPRVVAFELVARHAGTTAAHVYGALMGALQAACERAEVPYVGIPVATIKKHATGKGNAGKALMMSSAVRRWGLGTWGQDDNEADALWVAECAREGVL